VINTLVDGRDFGWKVTNQGSTRPSTTAIGTQCTPGNNSKGSWVQAFSAIAYETCLVIIQINANSTSGQARDTLVDIGVDEAGGSSYSVKIPDLSGCMAITPNKGGIFYIFPLRVKAGATIAVRASVNNATVSTCNVMLWLFGLPKNPESIRTITEVVALGVTAASSSGTAITPGTTNDGVWTLIGTLSGNYWYFQQGFCFNASSTSDRLYFVELAIGDGTNYDIIITDQPWGCDTTNRFNNALAPPEGCERDAPSGAGAYMRAQCSGSLGSNYSGIVYAGR